MPLDAGSRDAGTQLGPYEIIAPIGAGDMGEVYRARDTRLDRTVAIKVLPEHVPAAPPTTRPQSGAPAPGRACKLLQRMEAPLGFEPGDGGFAVGPPADRDRAKTGAHRAISVTCWMAHCTQT